jgi:hypothetical protein
VSRVLVLLNVLYSLWSIAWKYNVMFKLA